MDSTQVAPLTLARMRHLMSRAGNQIMHAGRDNARASGRVITVTAKDAMRPGILHIRRLDAGNVGDWFCSPFHYFDTSKPAYPLDIQSWEPSLAVLLNPGSPIVIGGGGLYYFASTINKVLAAARSPVVGWGIGHNTHFGSKAVQIDESKFTLLGVRDWGLATEWVPCVSCMANEIDAARAQSPKHDVVVYHHFSHPLHLPGLPTLTNACMNLSKVMDFLASGETVITNSYHGAYWAQLVGRKVVVVPFSSRFMNFRFAPVLATAEDCLSKIDQARAYPEALETCRTVTLSFAAKVAEVFKVDLQPRGVPPPASLKRAPEGLLCS